MRFAVALGIHSDEPSEQLLLCKEVNSAQRRKELQTLWHSIHLTDLWLTNACAFTVVNGPASSVPIEVGGTHFTLHPLTLVIIAYCFDEYCLRHNLPLSG